MSEDKTPQQLLFSLADRIIISDGKHVFLKILCDHINDDQAKKLMDEIITYHL